MKKIKKIQKFIAQKRFELSYKFQRIWVLQLKGFNPNPPDPLPLLLPADLYAIPFSTVCVSYLDQVSW